MKRLLLPLLTCSLLAACGTGGTPDTGGTGGGTGGTGGGTGNTVTYTVSGDVLLPGNGAQSVSSQSVSSAQQAQPNWSLPHVPGEVLIVGAGATGSATFQLPGTLSSLSVQATGAAGIQRVQTPAGETDAAFAARLTQQLAAQLAPQGLGTQTGLTVQPNYIYKALSVPNDPGYPVNKGVPIGSATALYDQDYLVRINALGGWDTVQTVGKTPVGAVTAVLDTGADFNHPELKGRLLPGYDFANNDSDPSEALGGDVGHGTSSAGLIGANTNNGVGLAGLTWSGQNLLPVKVFDDQGNATTVNLSRAVDYATAQGAKVINMSLGLVGANTDAALAQSIQSASNAGVVLVAAAGNTATDGLYYPASDPNVLAVGAVGQTDTLACYSARPTSGQKALDLVAPGGNAGTGTSNCFTTSDYDILTLAATSETNSARVRNGYALRAGTSEAAPLVSGAASLIRAFRPDLSAAQVKAALTGSAKTVAGGKLLDVGAAVKAAAALPQNGARAYTLSVSAGTLSKSFSGTLAAGASSVPYSLSGLPAGQTTLSARLTVGGTVSTGSLSLNVQSDLSGQSIQTR
ncbi:S8 family peptidase [Deinococcus sp. UYEF24]